MSQKTAKFDYDLICIGSGAGGGVAAHIAKIKGKKVAIVEGGTIGGECPNYGCIPTKALLSAVSAYNTIKSGRALGVKATTNGVLNYRMIKAWKDLAVKRTGVGEGERVFSADGIAVIKGRAHFLDRHTISVDGQHYRARHFVIASGAHSFIPPIPGLEETGFITYHQAINLTSPLKSVFIIGGGPIGCEFAHVFSSFDAKVYVAERQPSLLPSEDPEAGQVLLQAFRDNGAEILVSTEVTSVEPRGGKKVVHFKVDNRSLQVAVDEIFIATGLHPNLDLGLENAGVKYTTKGIKTNLMLRTTQKNIYAAGDVVGPYGFTHMAAYQSRIAVHNMFAKHKIQASYHAVPRVIFTEPEVAFAGMTENEAKAKKIKYRTNRVDLEVIGKSNVSNYDRGFVKVIASHTGVIIGAVIVSPSAGEMIHELTLAINLGLTVDDIASTIHAFPTWSEAIRIACAGL